MSGDLIYYLYEHWRPDKDVCFYVGKGKGNRAWDMKNVRNRHHKAITSKLTSMGLCVDVRIIIGRLSSEIAYELEKERISMYGMENLSNMTLGGEGMNPTPELRDIMSVAQKKSFAENPQRRLNMSISRKGRVTSEETKRKLSITSSGRTHTPEARSRISAARKAAGFPPHVREAQRLAVTGRKRAPLLPHNSKERKITGCRTFQFSRRFYKCSAASRRERNTRVLRRAPVPATRSCV